MHKPPFTHQLYYVERNGSVAHQSAYNSVCPTETERTTDAIDQEEIPGLYKCLNHLQSSTYNLSCLVP